MKKTIKIAALFLAAAMLFAGCANSSSSSSGDNDKKVDNITLSDGKWIIDVTEKETSSMSGQSSTEIDELHLEVTIEGEKVTLTKGIEKRHNHDEEDITSYAKYQYNKLDSIAPERLLNGPSSNYLSGDMPEIKKYGNDDGTKFRAKATASETITAAELAALLTFFGGNGGDITGDLKVTYTGEVEYSKQSE